MSKKQTIGGHSEMVVSILDHHHPRVAKMKLGGDDEENRSTLDQAKQRCTIRSIYLKSNVR